MYNYRAKLARVVDGDTVRFNVDLGFYLTVNLDCRLQHVNTPERGKPGWEEATAELTRLLTAPSAGFVTPEGWVNITTSKSDKYGRWLVVINSVDPQFASANELLIRNGFGVRYDP
jgi:micrococcal nuclease